MRFQAVDYSPAVDFCRVTDLYSAILVEIAHFFCPKAAGSFSRPARKRCLAAGVARTRTWHNQTPKRADHGSAHLGGNAATSLNEVLAICERESDLGDPFSFSNPSIKRRLISRTSSIRRSKSCSLAACSHHERQCSFSASTDNLGCVLLTAQVLE